MAEKIAEYRFDIDFIEFCFLVEACIPPRPIARTFFFKEVIDKYYHRLTKNERERLYTWINKSDDMKRSLKNNDEHCLWFNARFDKNNQYKVTTNIDGKIQEFDCFKHYNKYRTKTNKSINEDYITEVKKID